MAHKCLQELHHNHFQENVVSIGHLDTNVWENGVQAEKYPLNHGFNSSFFLYVIKLYPGWCTDTCNNIETLLGLALGSRTADRENRFSGPLRWLKLQLLPDYCWPPKWPPQGATSPKNPLFVVFNETTLGKLEKEGWLKDGNSELSLQVTGNQKETGDWG